MFLFISFLLIAAFYIFFFTLVSWTVMLSDCERLCVYVCKKLEVILFFIHFMVCLGVCVCIAYSLLWHKKKNTWWFVLMMTKADKKKIHSKLSSKWVNFFVFFVIIDNFLWCVLLFLLMHRVFWLYAWHSLQYFITK